MLLLLFFNKSFARQLGYLKSCSHKAPDFGVHIHISLCDSTRTYRLNPTSTEYKAQVATQLCQNNVYSRLTRSNCQRRPNPLPFLNRHKELFKRTTSQVRGCNRRHRGGTKHCTGHYLPCASSATITTTTTTTITKAAHTL